jgi:dihydrofolate reductase
MTTIYYTASSLDGFIADPEHSLSWLVSRDIDRAGPMGYDSFIASVGALAMGATTYRWLLEHVVTGQVAAEPGAEAGTQSGGSWPYDVPCWVFTHRDPPPGPGDIRFVRGPVADVHAEMLTAAGERDVWVVGGGDLAGQFADAGLLEEVWVQYAPVMLGAGAPLLPRRVELRLEEVDRNRDFACARYAVV